MTNETTSGKTGPSVPGSVTGTAKTSGGKADASAAQPAAAPAKKKLPWFRLAVIILFALVYAWDLFEAISNLFGVAAQITKYNENATLIGINTIAIPWAVLVANLLLPLIVFGLALLVSRKRNVGVLAIVLLAGLGVVAAVSLSLAELVGALT